MYIHTNGEAACICTLHKQQVTMQQCTCYIHSDEGLIIETLFKELVSIMGVVWCGVSRNMASVECRLRVTGNNILKSSGWL